MLTKYEDAMFDISLSDSYQLNLLRKSLTNPIKKKIGGFIGKPYKKDAILEFVFSKNILDPVVIDVGCHVGVISIPIAKSLPNSKVFCIDAYPVPLAKLIVNINLNNLKNISVINAAISDHPNLLNIYPCLQNAGGARVTGFKGRPEEHDGGAVLVPPISLSSIFSFYDLKHCDLLKIDIEGYELSALRSLGDILKPSVIKNVITEYGPEGCRSAGITGWDIVEYMLNRGYKCKDLHTNRDIKLMEEIPVLQDFQVTDFLFYTPDNGL
jgi:FkbM family methyltransferase